MKRFHKKKAFFPGVLLPGEHGPPRGRGPVGLRADGGGGGGRGDQHDQQEGAVQVDLRPEHLLLIDNHHNSR